MLEGKHTLKQAAKLADSDAPKLVEKLNWEEAKDNHLKRLKPVNIP